MSKNINKSDIDNIIQNTINNLKKVIETNTIVGTPVVVGNITIIPISKVSIGIISGAGEMNNKKTTILPFAGGSGSGFNLTPMGFISIADNDVKFSPIDESVMYADVMNIAKGIVNNLMGDNNETK